MTRSRDTRLDFIRALALLTIFVDHIPGNPFERITLKNFGFADAAEVFVLISGVAVGLAYAPRFINGGKLLTTLKIWRRAGVLYCAHIMTTVATLTIFCAAAVITGMREYLTFNNIQTLIDEPAQAFVGVGLLGHQLGYNNILSMYAVLLLAAPLIIWAARRHIGLTLLCSFAIWLAAGLWRIAPPNYPTEGKWFLNPLSWQLIFVIAICATVHVRRGGELPKSRILTLLCGFYLAGALIWIHSPLWGQEGWLGLPMVIAGFDKAYLPLPRLLDILALAYLAACVPALSRMLKVSPGNPLAVLGRHALPVFIAGTVLAMVGQVVRFYYPASLAKDVMIVSTGIAAQFALAYFLEWLAGAQGVIRAAATPAAQTASARR